MARGMNASSDGVGSSRRPSLLHSMAFLLQIAPPLLFVLLVSFQMCSSRKLDLGIEEAKISSVIPLNDSTFSSRLDPSRAIQLSWHPRVFLYEGFLSDEECDYLISMVHGKLNYSRTESKNGDVRKNNVLDIGQDEVISSIEERISAWTFLPRDNGEGMQIFHYGVNESLELYQHQNLDNFGNVIGRDQIATIIIFLSNVSRGGEIIFPNSKQRNVNGTWSECASSSFAMKHVKGNAILVFNLHPNATVDKGSYHGACSVLDGDKWSAIKRIHVRAFEVKKSSTTDSYEECVDEDDNCRRWAAMGECQRNPVYMLGSPDYYGTCRKSCGVC
ncbi:prolyl 4-hydroxylase [Apostasia shenzhenica]|uniref:procollagen-proline 4-dioxygenase n=1 Tax=Apostasia shenzhenica TaxID=1088818 RepID=A0A2I0B9V3_9ASPA|nr:prolyl 4-hydroxylase [Apostasia shenzhenica]